MQMHSKTLNITTTIRQAIIAQCWAPQNGTISVYGKNHKSNGIFNLILYFPQNGQKLPQTHSLYFEN